MTAVPEIEQALTMAISKSARASRRHVRQRILPRALLITVAVAGLSTVALAATDVWRPLAPEARRPLQVLGTHKTETLAAYRGKPLVVTFYASWCRPCRSQAMFLDKYAKLLRLTGRGNAVLIGIEDEDRNARNFARQAGLSIKVLNDPKATVAKAYGVKAVPETFVVDPTGGLVTIKRGAIGPRELDRIIARASKKPAK